MVTSLVLLVLLWSPLAWAQVFSEPPLVDDCNRTQNPLAAATPGPGSWAGPYNSGATGAWSANGTTCGLATATGGSLYFGTLQAADHALALIVPDAIGTTLNLQVRLQDPNPGGATFDAYVCRWAVSTNTVSLRKFIDNGSSAQLGSALTLTLAHGDGVACQNRRTDPHQLASTGGHGTLGALTQSYRYHGPADRARLCGPRSARQ